MLSRGSPSGSPTRRSRRLVPVRERTASWTCAGASGAPSAPVASCSRWRAGTGRSSAHGWCCCATRAARWTRIPGSCWPSSCLSDGSSGRSEVFAFNTELTRLTPWLSRRPVRRGAGAGGRGGAGLVGGHPDRRMPGAVRPGPPGVRGEQPHRRDRPERRARSRRPRAPGPRAMSGDPWRGPPGDLAQSADGRSTVRADRARDAGGAAVSGPPRTGA